MRIFALSDIHVDYDVNSTWVSALSLQDYQDDILILAGDISDSLVKIELCLTALARRFRKVLYVPGNHELWVIRDKDIADSMAKFQKVLTLARECGVSTETYRAPGVSIVPLFSWYDYSFGRPTPALKDAWTDFHACRWPPGWSDADVTRTLLALNDHQRGDRGVLVISFSHFLPRIDLMPSYIPEIHRAIYPVLGASGIEDQIRALGSRIHVYGHSHVNRRVRLDGVEYINNAFGYPRETRLTAKSLVSVHDTHTARGLSA